jgi:hypothetical protein
MTLYAYYSQAQYNQTGFCYQYLKDDDSNEIIMCSEISDIPPEEYLKTVHFKDMVCLGKVNKYIKTYESHIKT